MGWLEESAHARDYSKAPREKDSSNLLGPFISSLPSSCPFHFLNLV